MDEGDPLSGIVIILLLVLFNAVIVCAKNAISNVNDNIVKKKADAGSKKAKKLLPIVEKPTRYLNVMELVQNFIGILIGMAYFSYILPRVETAFADDGTGTTIFVLKILTYVIFTILLVYITVLFGLIIPRRFATRYAEQVAYPLTGVIKFLGVIFYPIAWLLELIMNILLRLFGIKPFDLTDNVTEEEIISMVNEGQEQGVLDAGEVEMISNIMGLGDKEAQDIMTPKKRIIALNSEMSVEEALRFMLSEKYSRYPLYEDNRDNIIGILYIKDVISAYISEELRKQPLQNLAREAYFIPDTMNVHILFSEMQIKNIHMAIVIDEYGQTAGLVAMEDFLEEIVGNIDDEFDEEESNIIAIEENSVLVKGAIGLDELEDELDIRLMNEDFDTLNGLLISLIDRIPMDGEQVTLIHEGYQFDVLETRNKMTQQVRITKLQAKVDKNLETEDEE
ncbi:MAG: hemolysin family protein [Mobilitalea sp.]